MTVAAALHSALINSLDAELLLASILKKDRSWLLAHKETVLTSEQEELYNALLERRKKHEPLAYILGEKEFYGRTFFVDQRVLIPRPSTEALIDEVKLLHEKKLEIETPRITEADSEIVIFTWIKPKFSIFNSPAFARATSGRQFSIPHIIDVGTGSGCIAITLALELPNSQIIATDISSDALEVAKMNSKKHGVLDRIEFMEIDGLPCDMQNFQTSKPPNSGPHPSPFLLVSNPPYIPENTPLPPDVSLYEPHEALFAGVDGMVVIDSLIQRAEKDPLCIGFVMEMGLDHAKKILNTLS